MEGGEEATIHQVAQSAFHYNSRHKNMSASFYLVLERREEDEEAEMAAPPPPPPPYLNLALCQERKRRTSACLMGRRRTFTLLSSIFPLKSKISVSVTVSSFWFCCLERVKSTSRAPHRLHSPVQVTVKPLLLLQLLLPPTLGGGAHPSHTNFPHTTNRCCSIGSLVPLITGRNSNAPWWTLFLQLVPDLPVGKSGYLMCGSKVSRRHPERDRLRPVPAMDCGATFCMFQLIHTTQSSRCDFERARLINSN